MFMFFFFFFLLSDEQQAARVFESQLAESILEGGGQLAFKKLATATLETLMPRIEGKGEFGQARWRLVYAPQIPSLLSVDPTVDPLKSLASNISFGTEVEIQLGKRLQVILFLFCFRNFPFHCVHEGRSKHHYVCFCFGTFPGICG